MFFIVFVLLCLLIYAAYVWITEQIDRHKRIDRAKKIFQIYIRYPFWCKELIIQTYNFNKKKALPDRFQQLESLDKNITVPQLVDLLNLKELEYLLTFPKSYFEDWETYAHKAIQLNQTFPFALQSVLEGRICNQRFEFNFECNGSKDYHFLTNKEVSAYSPKALKQLMKIPQEQLVLSNTFNEQVYNMTCAFNLAIHQSNLFHKEISPRQHEIESKFETNPFNKIQIKPTADYANIAYRQMRYNVNTLYHFTDRSNIESIIKNGGLYSWAALEQLHISSKMGGDELSHKLDKKVGLEDYVRLSPNNCLPMQYRLTEKGYDLILLEVHPIILLMDGVLFSSTNATANDAIIGSTSDHSKALACGANVGILSRDDKRFKASQAEVLVKHFLPLKYILNIYDVK